MTLPSSERYDTIVVGAGPAGIMAALHAAERGNVLVIDASSLPRDKSCGGMLHELSLEALAPYGDVPESIVVRPRTVHFRYVDWDRGIRKPTTLRSSTSTAPASTTGSSRCCPTPSRSSAPAL